MEKEAQKPKTEESNSDPNQMLPKKTSAEENEQNLILEAQHELQKRLAVEMARLFGQ